MKKKIKEIKYLEPKFFTECVNDEEMIFPSNNETIEAIRKGIEKYIKENLDDYVIEKRYLERYEEVKKDEI